MRPAPSWLDRTNGADVTLAHSQSNIYMSLGSFPDVAWLPTLGALVARSPPRARARAQRPAGSRPAASARLAGRLRGARFARAWTLDQAAEVTGLDVRQLQRIEAGTANVTLRTLEQLAHALGARIGELVDAEPRPRLPAPALIGAHELASKHEPVMFSLLPLPDQAAPPSGPRPAPAPPTPDQPPTQPRASEVCHPSEEAVVAVGARLARLRLDRGMTQADLAERAGLSLSLVRSAESGTKSATLRSLAQLAEALGVPLVRLFEEKRGRA